jgi:hypothetical protein
VAVASSSPWCMRFGMREVVTSQGNRNRRMNRPSLIRKTTRKTTTSIKSCFLICICEKTAANHDIESRLNTQLKEIS